MDGVGAVGGAGAAGGGHAVSPAAGAAAPGDGGGDVAGATPVKTSEGGASEASHGGHMCTPGSHMSTQNFVELHNTAITQVNESQCPEMDLKKLMEMMIAIELLKSMNESK